MEYQSDNFVTYTETTAPPNESFPDLDFMLHSSPFTDSSGGQSYSHESISHLQNHSVSQYSFGSSYASPEHQKANKVQKKRGKATDAENEYTMGENTERNMTELSNHSKKIQKRDKAKARAKIKQNMAMVLTIAPEKYIPSGIDDPNLDDKTKRKMIQMAKNRMAAQKTRDRKRAYTSELEEVKDRLAQVNEELEEKNRLLEEKIRALELSQVHLLQENQELKKNHLMEAFYQTSVENIPSSMDTGFDSNSEYKSLPSPAISRRSSRGTNNYFNFFLGIIAICAVYTGINIKIGQETENVRDPFKEGMDEWVMEGYQPKIEPVVEEVPTIVRTRTSRKDEEKTFSISGFVPPGKTEQQDGEPIMTTMSLTMDEIGDQNEPGYADDDYVGDDAIPMMMAMSAAMDTGRVYQPITPMKSKWEYVYEILTLHRGFSSKWESPEYLASLDSEPTIVSFEMDTAPGESDAYDSGEVTILVANNTEDDVIHQEGLNVNSTELETPESNEKKNNKKKPKKIAHQKLDYSSGDQGFGEGQRGFDENLAVQVA